VDAISAFAQSPGLSCRGHFRFSIRKKRSGVVPHAQSGNERLLRDRDVAILPHLGFALLLLLEQLAFAGRVAAIAFGGDVLPQGRDGLIGPAGGSKLLKTLINLRG